MPCQLPLHALLAEASATRSQHPAATVPPPLALRPADHAVGAAPLVHGEVYNGLSYHSLAMLEPCAITVQLSAEPLQPQQPQQQQQQVQLDAEPSAAGGEGDGEQQHGGGSSSGAPPSPQALQLLAPPEADQHAMQQQHLQQQQESPYRRVPAFTAALGQPLSVTLTVTNHSRACSSNGSSSGEAAAAGGGGLELQLDAAVACQPVRGSEQEEAAAASSGPGASGGAAGHELSAVWAGQLWTGLRLCVKPGQTVSQRLGLCLLAPGLYQIGLQHWQCRPAAAGDGQQEKQQRKKNAPPPPLVNTMVAVQPCFVLAAQ